MSIHTMLFIIISVAATACSPYKTANPTFETKYKAAPGDANAEGAIVARGDTSASTEANTAATPSDVPVLNQESETPPEPDVSYDLKDAQSYVSNKISCKDAELGIVGGAKATDDDLVAASTFRIVMNQTHYCTATLIGKNQLLTAAHCFEGVGSINQIEIGFGPDGEPPISPFRVTGYRIHPNYRGMAGIATPSPESQLYDLAVITFIGPLSNRMVPVRLAEPSYIYTGMPVVVAGYGAISSNDQARRPLAWLITELYSLNNKYNELQIKQKLGKGACYGDSGGPAYIVASDNRCMQLIGSISGPSRGTTNCDVGGGLLMDVTRQRVWVSCTLKKMGYPLQYIDTSLINCALSP